MLELERRSEWRDFAPSFPSITVSERRDLALAGVLSYAGQAKALDAAVAARFGIALPREPISASAGSVSFLGTGPGAWLAIGALSTPFVDELTAALRDNAAVIDQSGALIVLDIAGPDATGLLQKGVHVDLDPAAFAVGAVAVTRIAQIGVTLWKTDESGFSVAFARSLSDSFRHWLATSCGCADLAEAAP